MKTKQPLVSVIMPVHNAGLYLAEAIDSVKAQLHTNWELIAVDDGSTDNSLAILKQYAKTDKRVNVYSNKTRQGIGYSLNRALKVCKGEFIARMDADDICLPERFTIQIALLNKKPEVVGCGGQAAMIDDKGLVFAYKRFPTNPEILRNMIMKVVPIQHPMLMTRSAALKSYRYQENVSTAEDVDMLFYLLSQGKLSNVDSLIYKYRKSDRSNGYHNVKTTFYITFASRFRAMARYGYRPTPTGLLMTLGQYVVITLLPSKLAVRLFESFRFEPPFWKRPAKFFSLRLSYLLSHI